MKSRKPRKNGARMKMNTTRSAKPSVAKGATNRAETNEVGDARFAANPAARSRTRRASPRARATASPASAGAAHCDLGTARRGYGDRFAHHLGRLAARADQARERA